MQFLKERKNTFLSLFALIVLLLAASLVFNKYQNRYANTNESSPASGQYQDRANSQSISYLVGQKESGQTALQLLKAKYQVETKEFTGLGEFVTSINGLSSDDKHFWAFYVNGEMAQVGAGQYRSAEGDHIEWKLEEIK